MRIRKAKGKARTRIERHIERFDMLKKPSRQQVYLRPLIWLLCLPSVWAHKTKINKVNIEGLKPPYLLLCNHNSFIDFKVTTAAIFPKPANYVVAIDGFIKREWLLRKVGAICKRKFTDDIVLIRQLHRVVKNGDIAVLYPEARYSLCGTTAVLPKSLGKLAKVLRVPVVTMIMNGHHINAPFWNTKDRKIKNLEATFTQLFTKEEVAATPVDEINKAINAAFYYNDYEWQKSNNIRVSYPKRAEGLHKVLYQCPNCMTEYQMVSSGSTLHCAHCGKTWEMSELGELSSDGTGFSHIPDWYNWERKNVQEEVESGSYRFSDIVRIDSLPNAKGFIPLGEGRLIHDMDGFVLTGKNFKDERFETRWAPKSLYSCHIEYNYLEKFGDCVCLNTLTDSYYIYPQGNAFSITKIALATEELFKWAHPARAIGADFEAMGRASAQ
jgi:1-acyl-sn-glycerol-3-phosphate acyltransferase